MHANRADRMAQQIKALATKPDYLSSIPRAYLKERNTLVNYPMISTYALWHTPPPTQINIK